MRKGLTVTLMTVALAMLAMQALAEAPVISDIPSPVVGDGTSVTPDNIFVFPDALDLNKFVTDDTKKPQQILWSYETATSPIYLINGVPILASGDNPILPPTGKVINTQVLGGEHNPDGLSNTITIRNNHLSPLGQFEGGYTEPAGTTGVIDSETQWVTFYASDGLTVSQKAVLFYTAHDENSWLSGSAKRCYTNTAPASGTQFTYTYLGGDATSSTPGNAICMSTGAAGINWAVWSGTYGQLPLVKNSVYRIRATINGSNATVGATPFWDMIVNNFDGVHGLNAYGCNYFVFDNLGGANGMTTADKVIDVWYNPTCISNTKWNDTTSLRPGPFADAYAANKDAYLQFRVLDVNNNGGIHADTSLGALCMKNLVIDRFELGDLAIATSNLVNVTNLTDGTAGGNTYVHGVNIVPSFSGGALTIAPTIGTTDVDDGRQTLLGMVEPGDDQLAAAYNNMASSSTSAEFLKCFPVAENPGTLYQVHFGLQAPSSADEAAPPKVMWLGADVPTNETIFMSYVTSADWGNAMPAYSPSGIPQDYKLFFWSNYGTASTNPAWWKQMRPRFMFGNTNSLATYLSSGSIVINYYSVDAIRLPGE